MKTAEDWYSDFLVNKSPDGDLQTIEDIQNESWNEAIKAASETIFKTMLKSNEIPSPAKFEKAILKLLK